MNVGHLARFCKPRCPPPRLGMEGSSPPDNARPSSLTAFLPSRAPTPGRPFALGCVALAEALGPLSGDTSLVLSRGLAARFGGSCSDYVVALLAAPRLAIFFPNWVAHESAVARRTFRVDDLSFRFSYWVELAEKGRGHLLHKVWIRLHHWPILCWNKEDVLAAVSGFSEVWEIDEACDA